MLGESWDALAKDIGKLIVHHSPTDTLTALAAVMSAVILNSYSENCDEVLEELSKQIRGSVGRLNCLYKQGRTIQ